VIGFATEGYAVKQQDKKNLLISFILALLFARLNDT